MKSIRILMVDDNRTMREALCCLLGTQSDMEVIAEADNGQEAVRLAQELGPDVVIMDISMPGLNGIEATSRIIAVRPEVRVVAVSLHEDRRYVDRMLKAGASAFVSKECTFKKLAETIRSVYNLPDHLSVIPGQVVDQCEPIIDRCE